jgi:hypothetical protein
MSKYGMTDSGKRQAFGKGMAIRDTADDKPRPDLISPFAEERQGHWLRMGAAKYAERNWENGMPFSRCVASLKRHVMRYQQGKQDEDHLAAIMFNAMALIHYEEMIERGRLLGFGKIVNDFLTLGLVGNPPSAVLVAVLGNR